MLKELYCDGLSLSSDNRRRGILKRKADTSAPINVSEIENDEELICTVPEHHDLVSEGCLLKVTSSLWTDLWNSQHCRKIMWQLCRTSWGNLKGNWSKLGWVSHKFPLYLSSFPPRWCFFFICNCSDGQCQFLGHQWQESSIWRGFSGQQNCQTSPGWAWGRPLSPPSFLWYL